MSDRVLFIVVGVGLCLYMAVSLLQFSLWLRDKVTQQNIIAPPRDVVHLPTTCRPYLNDGTDKWINCMGVEKK